LTKDQETIPVGEPSYEPPQLPTPRATPEVQPLATRKEIGLNLDPKNIVHEKRTRKPSTKYDSYHAELRTQQSSFLAAFIGAQERDITQSMDSDSDEDQSSPHLANFAANNSASRTTRVHQSALPKAPKRWSALNSHPYEKEFTEAAYAEWKGLEDMGTIEDIDRTKATSWPLPLMWVFTYKLDKEGFLIKCKARIVVRGDLQQFPEYRDTYAATLAAKNFRALMAIAAHFDLDVHQYDVQTAFLNAKLRQKVFVRYPDGIEKIGRCILLLNALYGLRISPKLWYEEFSSFLIFLGFSPIPDAPCLYVKEGVIVFFYVDDIVVLSWPNAHNKFLDFRTKLQAKYKVRELREFEWFLGIRIVRDRQQRKIWLCQDSYVDKMVLKFLSNTGSPPNTPLDIRGVLPYEGRATPTQVKEYGERVGSVNYAAIMTRPDISCAAQKLAEFLQNPGPRHIAEANRTLSYLDGTRTLGLEYGPTTQDHFQAASDASYADDIATRRSTEGYVFFLFGGPIEWRCTKQKTVTTSTTEAELLALSHAAVALYCWLRLFQQLQLELQEEITLHCDNQQTVRLLTTDTLRLITKLRHVDIHNMWLRQEVVRGKLQIEWVATNDMKADGFTKPLPRNKHEEFVRQLNLQLVSATK
jgi:hypothetical protein